MNAWKTVTRVECQRETTFNTFLHFPEGYRSAPQEPWPAVLFLHGRNELGKDYETLPDGGLSHFIGSNSLPLVVLEPQCPADSEWVFELDALAEFLHKMIREHNLDPHRIYLTGLSMGGIGAWHLGIRYPELFAAVVPVCGGTYPFLGFPEAVLRLKDVPVWAFHGLDDDILPVGLTKVLVDRLVEAQGKIRVTYYENTGHDAWTKTYTNPEVYRWLLGHRRADRGRLEPGRILL